MARGAQLGPTADGNSATVPAAPSVAAKATPNPVGVGLLVTLGESIKGGVGPFSYAWAVVSAPAASAAALSSTTDANPTFTPDAAGSYQLSLTVTDSIGRSSPPGLVVVQATVP